MIAGVKAWWRRRKSRRENDKRLELERLTEVAFAEGRLAIHVPGFLSDAEAEVIRNRWEQLSKGSRQQP